MANGKRSMASDNSNDEPISGVVDLRPKRAPIDWDEARRLHVEDGLSFAEIATRIHYTARYVRQHLRDLGVKAPSRPRVSASSIALYGIWDRVKRQSVAVHDEGQSVRPTAEGWANYAAFRDWCIGQGYQAGMRIIRKNEALPHSQSNSSVVPHMAAIKLRAQRHGLPPRARIEAFGERKGANEWSRDPRCRVSRAVLVKRFAAGIAPEIAITSPPGHASGTPTERDSARNPNDESTRTPREACSSRKGSRSARSPPNSDVLTSASGRSFVGLESTLRTPV